MTENAQFDERQQVLEWRFGCLRKAGWPPDLSTIVANLFDIDLHQACGMVEAGAAPLTAFRILVPDDIPLPAKYAAVQPPLIETLARAEASPDSSGEVLRA